MQRAAAILTMTLALAVTTGCASKKELEAVKAELEACAQEKAEAEAAVISWEARFDRESDRWESLEASVSQALPQALQEFHAERQQILELVPEQVQNDVEIYLDDYFNTVMKGFQLLQDDSAEIKLELRATQKALDALRADTRNINAAIDQTLAEERQKRDQVGARIATLADHLSDVVDQVVEFDQTRVNCKGCPQRLKLNRKEREAILGFHAELMSDLSDLQSRASAAPTVAPPDSEEADPVDTSEGP